MSKCSMQKPACIGTTRDHMSVEHFSSEGDQIA
jgi:hypothetical protein